MKLSLGFFLIFLVNYPTLLKANEKYSSISHHFKTFDLLDDGYLIFDTQDRTIVYQNMSLENLIGNWELKNLVELGENLRDKQTGERLCHFALFNNNKVTFHLNFKNKNVSIKKLPGWDFNELIILKWVVKIKPLISKTLSLNLLARSTDDIILQLSTKAVFEDAWAKDPSKLFMPLENFIGKSISEVFPKKFSEEMSNIFHQVVSSKNTKTHTYKDPSGISSSIYTATFNYLESFKSYPIVTIHISETHLNPELKNKLQETSRLLDNLFRIPGGPMVYVEELGNTHTQTYCSPNAYDLTGYPVINGKLVTNWSELIHPLDREAIISIQDDFLASENTEITLEYRILTKVKEVKWIKEFITKVYNPTSNKNQIQGAIIDITYLKATSKAFEESVLRFNKAFENAPLGMALISSENEWLQTNLTLKAILGYTDKELKPLSIQDITHPDDLQNEISLLSELESGRIDKFDVKKRFVKKNGTTLWTQQYVSCVRGSKGEISYYIFQIQDISELIIKEEALIRAREDAENAAKAKSDFLSQMSHEIRTPLNSVVGISNILLEDFADDDRLKDPLSILKSGSSSLLSIVNNILDLNKIESGKLLFEKIKFNLKDIIDDSLNTYLQRIEEKKLSLHFYYPPDLPKTFIGDPFRINQILHNLTSNAVKYTKKGDITISVRGREIKSNDWVIEVSIKDTGIGISKSAQPIIFMPFEQGTKNRARKFGGSGLGLSIVKTLVELMEGEISVESQFNKGSKFTFTLPLKSSANSKKKGVHSKQAKHEAFDGLKGKKVLLVEDNLMNIQISKRYLEKWNTDYVIAESGESAINFAIETQFDVILMDLQLPGVDGLEALKIIRQKGVKSPALLLTATTNFVKPKNYSSLKIKGIVFKPFLPSDLYEKMVTATAE